MLMTEATEAVYIQERKLRREAVKGRAGKITASKRTPVQKRTCLPCAYSSQGPPPNNCHLFQMIG
jgi:hypothetical protein